VKTDRLLSFADALALTLDAASPIARTETIALADADGRVVAREVIATADVPPFSRSAMDGYAVRAADTAGASDATPVSLTCIGVVFAGQAPSRPVGRGECMTISTGAPMPDGADAVVMVERTRRTGEVVAIGQAATEGQHVGRQGSDMPAGSVVVAAGDVLDPARLGAVAGAGVGELTVYAKPTVALVSTGNEVIEPGVPLAPGQIHDINRFTLASVVRRHGGEPVRLPATGDSVEALTRALDQARSHDVVVFSGGSSVGERDLLRDAVAARGEIVFHGIAVKPGKPTLFARVEGTPVFGMPGNPTSCLSNGYLLLAPFLRRVARLPAWAPMRVDLPLAAAIRSPSDRHQFYTVRLEGGRVAPAFKGSGDITSMARADGYIEIAAGTGELAAGTIVTVTVLGSGLD
jgi:molybdenum cofactor synthesis domain-containing protein